MRILSFAATLLATFFVTAATQAAPVLMVSIDGLRPADVLDAQARGIAVPNLSAIVQDGAYATGVVNVLPTVTYPNHTTLITGVAPAVHGISNNVTFDPLNKNIQGWYWYTSDIKVPTLWDAVHDAHGVVASVSWPVSVGASSIDYNVPEYWRALTADDLKLLRVLATPGLLPVLEKESGTTLAASFSEEISGDVARGKFTAALIALKHPEFTTLHIVSLDSEQHAYGPGTPEAHKTLEQIDGIIGTLVAAARAAEPDLIVAIVSDHGFATIGQDVNLFVPFIEAGLITVDAKTGKVADWQAEPWPAGGSAAVVLKDPSDAAVKDKVAALLKKLAADNSLNIGAVMDTKAITKMGGGKEASFWVGFKPGTEMGHKLSGPLVTPGSIKGNHGYLPIYKEMRSTFFIAGPGLPKKGSLGEIDMRDIAPTLAKLMNVKLPSATGKPLF